MKEIKMVDLNGQYQNIKQDIDRAIQSVIDSAEFVKGTEVRLFEKELAEYLSCKHVIACANGTDALQIAMMALGLKPGDEVITPDFTFVATVEVIALLGLKPVLVDVDRETFNIDTNAIEKAITPRTKAIVPVHLFGQCANMDAIQALAQKYNLFVIEDTAQALGADFTSTSGKKQKAGTIGTIGCTSFFPSKNLGCFGDGGALMTNNDALAETIRSIANHGMKVRYYHDTIGVNSRLDTLQAAILRVKLKHLETYNAARQKAAAYYDTAFQSCDKILTPKRSPFSTHVFHQYTLQVKNTDRDALQAHLAGKKIPSMIYYPVPMHAQKAYSEFVNNARFPVTDELSKEVISLPMHTELDTEQLEYITRSVLEFIK